MRKLLRPTLTLLALPSLALLSIVLLSLVLLACAPFDQEAVLKALARDSGSLRTDLLVADGDLWGMNGDANSFYVPVPDERDPDEVSMKRGFLFLVDSLGFHARYGEPDGSGGFEARKEMGLPVTNTDPRTLNYIFALVPSADTQHKFIAILRPGVEAADPTLFTLVDYDRAGDSYQVVPRPSPPPFAYDADYDIGTNDIQPLIGPSAIIGASFALPQVPGLAEISLILLVRMDGTSPPQHRLLRVRIGQAGILAIEDVMGYAFPLDFLPATAHRLFAYHDASSDRSYVSFASETDVGMRNWAFWVDGRSMKSMELTNIPGRIDAVLSTGMLYNQARGFGRFFDGDGNLRGRMVYGEGLFIGERYFPDGYRMLFFTGARPCLLQSFSAPSP